MKIVNVWRSERREQYKWGEEGAVLVGRGGICTDGERMELYRWGRAGSCIDGEMRLL
jgi:hypothetical protein